MEHEFTRWVDPEELARSNNDFAFEATSDEMKAISVRLGLLSMERFQVSIKIAHGLENGTYTLTGSLEAKLAQPCVVSLKSVPDHVTDKFEVILAGEGYDIPDDEDEDWDDDIEIITPKGVDVGEIATQYLSMSLNKFPRSEDGDVADLGAKDVTMLSEEEAAAARNPFHVLKDIKERG
ncbi:MAG: DUF177 domain-containing protein [Sphingomonadales bacterium]|nr:DUF177 domain-containing protein [Sphingomonadales bacterium]